MKNLLLTFILVFNFFIPAIAQQSEIITPDHKRGYYNYAPINENSSNEEINAHCVMDIVPWIKWGYSPKDTTTPEERLKALQDSPEWTMYKDCVNRELSEKKGDKK